MRATHRIDRTAFAQASDLAHIARPESMVLLAETVRAAREAYRGERIEGLRVRVSGGGYSVSSKDLAQRVLSSRV